MPSGNRKTKPETTGKRQKPAPSVATDLPKNRIRSVRSGRAGKLRSFFSPMLASIYDHAFNDKDWIFEIKWDGYRAIAETGETTRLYSRNGLSFLPLYPKLAAALQKIKQ